MALSTPQFGSWTWGWSQFRRWSRNGVWSRLLAELHRKATTRLGRAEVEPSMVVIDTHLARGTSNGGSTSYDRSGPCGATKGAKRAVAADVTGLPLAAAVLQHRPMRTSPQKPCSTCYATMVTLSGWSLSW